MALETLNQRPTILLVDDDSNNLVACKAMLESIECSFVTASSGEEALRCLMQEEIALVISDVKMSGISGIELVALMRTSKRTSLIPVILVTASFNDMATSLMAYQAGGADYMTKPVAPDILRSKVRVYLELVAALGALKNSNYLLAKAETRAHEAAQNAIRIIEAAPNGMLVVDANGEILQVNTHLERLFGYERTELLGKSVEILIPETSRPVHSGLRQSFFKSPSTRSMGVGRDLAGLRKDGTTVPIEITLNPIQAPAGLQVLASIIDVTERKKLERMKSEFVSTVSHELRTPLTSISGALGLLCGGTLGELPPEVNDLLNLSYKNSQRLNQLINDLLDVEKLSSGKAKFNLKVQALLPLIELSLQTMDGYAKKYQVDLKLTNLLDGVLVDVDGSRLQQVLGNFLSNAVKFSPSGETVELRVEPATQIRKGVRVTVIDSGPGIAESFRPRVFERFAQADSSDQSTRGGTGLGLAIAKEMIEKMQGLVGFETEVGKGSEFYLELPEVPDLRHPSTGNAQEGKGTNTRSST